MASRRIGLALVGVVVVAALLGGCGLLKKKTKATGIPECDLYIAEYECFMKKSSDEATASRAAQVLADSLTSSGAGTGAVAQSCTAQRTAMAEQLKTQACLLGPAPAAATTATATAATTVDAS